MSSDTSKTQGTLLIVDDEEDIREILSELLEGSVAKIETASNGKEALEIVKKGEVDAVISDISMPVMNGLEFLFQIRHMGIDVPFVFVTGFSDKENTLEALRLGATDFIEKPFDVDVVLSVMKRAMELSFAMKEVEAQTEKLYASQGIPVDQRHKLRKMKQSILMMRKDMDIYSKKGG